MLSVRLRVVMYFHAPFCFCIVIVRYCKFYENKKKAIFSAAQERNQSEECVLDIIPGDKY